MSEIVYGDPRIDQWVCARLGFRQWSESFSIANVGKNGILGAVVFHNYYPETGIIELTCVSDSAKWMNRELINAVAFYAFDALKCQLVLLRVSEINARMIDIAKRLSFKGYLIPRLRGRNEAEWIFTLTDDDWRKSPYRRT